jgi:hypothetical protein
MALRRFSPATAGVAATTVALIVALGGFIFYNTNKLNRYRSAPEETERRAEYERRYRQYSGSAQPTLTSTNLRVEIYPERGDAEISGTYVLANTSAIPIDSIHLTTVPGVETGPVSFDQPASPALVDDDLGFRTYALEKPLQPGDSLHLAFTVHVAPHGFRNNGADAFVVPNGSHFTNRDWLPAIGYQRTRELSGAGPRKQNGLAPRPDVPPLDDAEARRTRVGGDPIAFEAIVGTSADQIAIAPGTLRRTWTEGGHDDAKRHEQRRYFDYVTDTPINNEYGVFSANYAEHEEQWRNSGSGQTVTIQIFHHPGHTANLSRMLVSVRASLDLYTRQFGPYPYSYIRLIENPGAGMAVHTEAATIEYGEGFSLLNPGSGRQERDVVFAIVAHGVARGWWGMQVAPADVAGSGLLDVSLETYSGMRVVEETLGPDQLRRYLQSMGEEVSAPRTRALPPLLRATDSFSFARKGPLALYAMRRYIGKDRVDDALRNLLRKYGSGSPPLPTSLDLYHELQAVTPDTYQPLLRDLFEKNTFWELAAERATAKQTSADAWQVTLDVHARKVTVDRAGIETEVPMDDWIEVGVFGEGRPFTENYRIHAGKQTITMTVPFKPARAGIDPDDLLIDLDSEDNMKDVKVEK